MSNQSLPAVRIAQIVGITSASWLSGGIAAFSTAVVQSMFNANTPAGPAARVWQQAFEIGKSSMPVLALVPAACYSYLAYESAQTPRPDGSSNSTAFYLYLFAAIAVPSIAPFTIAIMSPTNNQLLAIADAAKAGVKAVNEGETLSLLGKWYWLNLTRAVLPAAGALAASYATLCL